MFLQSWGLQSLTLSRNNEKYPLYLSLIRKARPLDLQNQSHLWLNDDEITILEDIKSDKKRSSFLLGRYSVKLGIAKFLGDQDLLGSSVIRGALGQPVVRCPQWDAPEVSIAHSSDSAAALVFPSGQQLGVDLEHIHSRESRIETLNKKLTPGEHRLMGQLESPIEQKDLLYMLWAMKEALSKVLRCGLTLPFEALELKSLLWDQGYLQGRFTHFTQYRSLAEASEDRALALVLPWKSSIIKESGEIL
ncbi:MAG: 4'-phosphopantetheinyl transferase superfamily protein [Spirochaetaceae bacterium]|jgi:4'-phosphopantetheinyl transferase|nr:4'-phosphopantetheinyl transferase superfamily protein [Spirochaetaceae bacterium]